MYCYKTMNYIVFMTLILSLSLGGCQLFGPPNVEIVVPGRVDLTGWSLSPEGDKIAYDSPISDTYVLFPKTGQTYKFDDCGSIMWFDNETLHCRGNRVILFKDTIHKDTLTSIRASEVDLENLFQTVDRIYTVEQVSNYFFAFKDDIQHQPENSYLVTEVENLKAILADVDYIPLSFHQASINDFEFGEKVYAPNKEYYFIWENNIKLSIFEAATDKKLSEFEGKILLILGGWAADSSGVYFQIHTARGILPVGPIKPKIIRKLRVP